MKEYKFPEGFYFGSATSALQVEGTLGDTGRAITVWDKWYEEEPEAFFNGENNAVGVDFYHRYKEDVACMKETGHNSFRFSIAWSRLIPNPMSGEVNPKALEFYNGLIDSLIEAGIEPFVCLFHFDMPWSMQELGGWESKEVLDYFRDFGEICFKLFGDRVNKWFTHNEPNTVIEGAYFYGFHYPKVMDFKRGMLACYNIILSNSMITKVFKDMRDAGELKGDAEIGMVLSLTPAYPENPENSDDVEAARICDAFFVNGFLDPAVLGKFDPFLVDLLSKYDAVPETTTEELKLIAENTVEFLGFNYYFPRRVKHKEGADKLTSISKPEDLYGEYVLENRRFNADRGWEIYPEAIYDMLIRLKNDYGNPRVYIGENGIGRHKGDESDMDEFGVVQDNARIEFVKDHLKCAHRAIEEGSNCVGYHMWATMDNWSMSNAYKNRYGFIYIDRENNLERRIKKSGYWLKEIVKNNGFSE